MLLILLTLVTLQTRGQGKQIIQVKTFDQKLTPFKNIDLVLNETIRIKTNDKGSAFVEVAESDLPIRKVDVSNEGLEIASWNLSKGTIEIIVRKQNFRLTTVIILDEKGQPLNKTDVIFTGSKKINIKTTAEGTVQLPLGLDERITSPNQFSIKGIETIRLLFNNGTYTLITERLADPSTAAIQTTPVIPKKRSYENEIASLDSIRSLTVFYQVVLDIAMDALDEDQINRVDAKFSELLKNTQVSADSRPIPGTPIADSVVITDEIRRLIARANEDKRQLELQRREFDTRIKALDKGLAGGIAGMDAATRDRLLKDIIELENLLLEKEREFDKNQEEFSREIGSLKERYFDFKQLEKKLSESELLREQKQKEFERQILIAAIIFVIFLVLLILLARFSNSMRKQKKAVTLANNEIKKINETLEERVISRTKLLQEANTELDTFLYRASHDLRTPVASIEGIANIADHISQTEFVSMVRTATGKMDNLLKDLSIISEINYPSEPLWVNVKVSLKSVESRLENLLSKSNIEILWSCPEALNIKTHPVFLEIIMVKLLENAVFFTGLRESVSPVIKVSVGTRDTNVIIKVEDNGVGIPETVLPRIFDMFYKGHEKSKGSGLGLYIVSRCLRLMKGEVTVQSEVDKFTRIIIQLPESVS